MNAPDQLPDEERDLNYELGKDVVAVALHAFRYLLRTKHPEATRHMECVNAAIAAHSARVAESERDVLKAEVEDLRSRRQQWEAWESIFGALSKLPEYREADELEEQTTGLRHAHATLELLVSKLAAAEQQLKAARDDSAIIDFISDGTAPCDRIDEIQKFWTDSTTFREAAATAMLHDRIDSEQRARAAQEGAQKP